MNSYVYFVQGESSRRVKIGSSKDPMRRLAQLRTGSAERLIFLGVLPPELGWSERELHDLFSECRAGGEWFELSDELRQYILDNAEGFERPPFPPLPPKSEAIPMCRVWWKSRPVIDVDALRSWKGAA